MNFKKTQKIADHPVQLKSVELNDLYLRRKSRTENKMKYELQVVDADYTDVPDEYSPAEKIQTPPNFLKWTDSHRKSIIC